jgi:hypothetical protein
MTLRCGMGVDESEVGIGRFWLTEGWSEFVWDLVGMVRLNRHRI